MIKRIDQVASASEKLINCPVANVIRPLARHLIALPSYGKNKLIKLLKLINPFKRRAINQFNQVYQAFLPGRSLTSASVGGRR